MLVFVFIILGCTAALNNAQENNSFILTYTADGVPRNPVLGWCQDMYCNLTTQALNKEAIRDRDSCPAGETSFYTSDDCENICFGKPAWGTEHDGFYDHPCGATNGYWDYIKWFKKDSQGDRDFRIRCYWSYELELTPWLVVDLQGVFTFLHFKLAVRNLFSTNTKYRDAQPEFDFGQLKGLDILLDDQICYHFPPYNSSDNLTALGYYMTLPCVRPMTGRYIRFQKRDEGITTRDYRRRYKLVFCEIAVWVCKPGYYGHYANDSNGCTPCPQDCDYPCDNYHGCQHVLHNTAMYKSASITHGVQFSGNITDMNRGFLPTFKQCLEMTSTELTLTLWWRVDLQAPFSVFYVNISSYYKLIQGSQPLSNFSIVVTMNSRVPEFPSPDELCAHVRGLLPLNRTKKLECGGEGSIIGRYVYVTSKRQLGFCRLEVFGRRVWLRSSKEDCGGTSNIFACDVTAICQGDKCKWKVGQQCNNTEDCVDEAVCHLRTCKKDVGSPCSPGMQECRRGSFCKATSNKCILETGQSCEKLEDACPEHTTCDSLKRCGVNVDESCVDSSECTSGAQCEDSKCECQSGISEQEDNHCKPVSTRIGSSCNAENDCLSQNCSDNKCACGPDEQVYAQDYTCRKKAGTACNAGTRCNTGMVCENNVCKLTEAESCYGNEEHCRAELVCESFYCKLGLDQNCANHPDMCKSGTTCYNNTCKIVHGGSCEENRDSCSSGFCNNDSICRIDVNQPCGSDTEQFCRHGSSCEDQLCKLNFGVSCSSTSQTPQCQMGAVCSSRDVSSEKKCKRSMGRGCTEDEDCEENSICDNLGQCRLSKTSNCADQPKMCVNGAYCSSEQCVCNTTVATDTDRCDAKLKEVGGRCGTSQDNPCRSNGTFCNPDSKCQCMNSYVAGPATLDCLLDAGTACSRGEDAVPCADGTVCGVGGVCVLKAKVSCEGNRRGLCMTGTSCDASDHKCRINVHENCTDSSECAQGATCDLQKRCKKSPNQLCRKDLECMSGAHCNMVTVRCECKEGVSQLTGGKCVPREGRVGSQCGGGNTCSDQFAECKNGQCGCKVGYDTDPLQLTCAKSAGQQCSMDNENTENKDCVPGLLCDSEDSICKVQPGWRCDGERQELCAPGSVCDLDKKCRLKLKGNCSGENNILCSSGTYCDWLGRCTLAVGSPCSLQNDTDDCPAGATCADSVCACDIDVSNDIGGICEPLEGMFGSSCELSCSVENSECVEGECVCIGGTKPSKRFECEGTPEYTSPDFTGLVIGVVTALLVVFTIAVGVSSYMRHRDKKIREIAKLTRERRSSLHQLDALAEAVQDVIEMDQEQTESQAKEEQNDMSNTYQMSLSQGSVGQGSVSQDSGGQDSVNQGSVSQDSVGQDSVGQGSQNQISVAEVCSISAPTPSCELNMAVTSTSTNPGED